MITDNSTATVTAEAGCPDWCALGPHGHIDTADASVRVLASPSRGGYVRLIVPVYGHVFDEDMSPDAALKYAASLDAETGADYVATARAIRKGVTYATSRRAWLAARMQGQERVPGEQGLDPKLLGGMGARLEAMMHSSLLAPWDLGIRFESDPISTAHLPGAYPVVRWADRWGTRCEHRRGEVRKVAEGEDWYPSQRQSASG